jgi:hypothetical protein
MGKHVTVNWRQVHKTIYDNLHFVVMLFLCLMLLWTLWDVAQERNDLLEENQQLIQNCEEDESCWDCEIMGNKVCGPVMNSFKEFGNGNTNIPSIGA